MQQRDDRLDAPIAQALAASDAGAKITDGGIVRRNVLPKHRRPACVNAERGDQRRIAFTRRVSRFGKLIAHRRRIDARDRGFG